MSNQPLKSIKLLNLEEVDFEITEQKIKRYFLLIYLIHLYCF